MRHGLSFVLGLLLVWTMTNADGSPTLPLVWYAELTMYFRTVIGMEADGAGEQHPIYSSITPARYYLWPGNPACGPPGTICAGFDNDPGLGDIWMWEDPPAVKPD